MPSTDSSAQPGWTRTAYEQMIRELEKDERLVIRNKELLQSTLPACGMRDAPSMPREKVDECYEAVT